MRKPRPFGARLLLYSCCMATQRETAEYILEQLGSPRFTTRAMFGEYALYADGQVVALICDDLLYVKILPESAALATACEQGEPYPGAKLHYVVDESQLSELEDLPDILYAIAAVRVLEKSKKKLKSKK